jgi:hypothetical protein
MKNIGITCYIQCSTKNNKGLADARVLLQSAFVPESGKEQVAAVYEFKRPGGGLPKLQPLLRFLDPSANWCG